jgi:hypothetical protein
MRRLLVLVCLSGSVGAQVTSVPPATNPNAPDVPRRQMEDSRRVIIMSNPPVRFDPLRERSPWMDQLLGLPSGWPADARSSYPVVEEPLQRIEPIRQVQPFATLQPFETIKPIEPIKQIEPLPPLKGNQ